MNMWYYPPIEFRKKIYPCIWLELKYYIGNINYVLWQHNKGFPAMQ